MQLQATMIRWVSEWLFAGVLAFSVFVQNGYIQPDEFFQNPEITAGDIFNISHFRAWEFHVDNALRTISIPYLTTGIPFLILRCLEWLVGFHAPAGVLLLLPRLTMVMLVLQLDWFVQELGQTLGLPRLPISKVLRTSHLTWVFLTRTFSNSVEVILFAALLHFVLSPKARKISHKHAAVWAGAVSAFGVFNRPTFLAFGLVPWIYLLSSFPIFATAYGVFSGILLCIVLTGLDSWYYGRFVITPLQFIWYNLNPENNAAHGLHPRYFHALVSLPQLFGPLLLVFLTQRRGKLLCSNRFLMASFLVPLFLISLVPHQEPRFLLALMVPLFLFTGSALWSSPFLRCVWLLFNVVVGLFFGVVHQGGVVQSLTPVRELIERHPNAQVFYYKTYIPPLYPLALGRNESYRVVDLGLSKINFNRVRESMESSAHKDVYLVIPATVDINLVRPANASSMLYKRFCPHWSFEVQPDYWELFQTPAQLCLNMWHFAV